MNRFLTIVLLGALGALGALAACSNAHNEANAPTYTQCLKMGDYALTTMSAREQARRDAVASNDAYTYTVRLGKYHNLDVNARREQTAFAQCMRLWDDAGQPQ